jgi:hypothetical protein
MGYDGIVKESDYLIRSGVLKLRPIHFIINVYYDASLTSHAIICNVNSSTLQHRIHQIELWLPRAIQYLSSREREVTRNNS